MQEVCGQIFMEKTCFQLFQCSSENGMKSTARKLLTVNNVVFENDLDKARYLASTQKESNAWLQALPSRSVGTLLDNNTFRISLALRLGSPLCSPHTCVCGERVSAVGTHGLSCVKSAGRASRHSQLNDIICRALVSAGVPSVLEPVGLQRDDGRRPDGMSLVPWKDGKCVVWDATCGDTVAPSHIEISARHAGRVAETRASQKKTKYKQIVEDDLFVPFSVENLKPWGHGLNARRNLPRISEGDSLRGPEIEEPLHFSRREYLLRFSVGTLQRLWDGNTANVPMKFPDFSRFSRFSRFSSLVDTLWLEISKKL
ncbi:hypothetical protein M8J77_006335 [Diaphorina citri]|nr:hypothetical protein M8J77_006335 [Diaphorina citri]